jgi:hypothetical protein
VEIDSGKHGNKNDVLSLMYEACSSRIEIFKRVLVSADGHPPDHPGLDQGDGREGRGSQRGQRISPPSKLTRFTQELKCFVLSKRHGSFTYVQFAYYERLKSF